MDDFEKEQYLINLKKRCDNDSSPYLAMILGMWTEEFFRAAKPKSPFPQNNKLGFWFVEGFYASQDARKMLTSTK